MFLLAEVLLAEVLLAGVLLFGFLLVVEEETVLVVSGLLEEKGMILLGSEILGEEKALLFSSALLVIWYSWNLFSSVDWTGGHRQSYFWSLPMYQCADTTERSL
jgi:hypothetical protein